MHNIFEKFIEIIGWIRIVLSPLIIGLFIGFVCYINIKSSVGIIFGPALRRIFLCSIYVLKRLCIFKILFQ
jgi:hypothetical protein